MGRKKKVQEDNGEYVSRSSIDSPPREPKADKPVQEPLIKEDKIKELDPQAYDVKLALVLKSQTGVSLPISIPMVKGISNAANVYQAIDTALNSKRFQTMLAGVTGEQNFYPEIERKITFKKGSEEAYHKAEKERIKEEERRKENEKMWARNREKEAEKSLAQEAEERF